MWIALGIVYVLWGSTYLAIRLVVETLPPFLSAGARYVTAGLLLLGLVAWRRGPGAVKVTRRQLGSAFLVGLLLLLGGGGLVVLASTSLPSGLVALLISVVPAWVVLLKAAAGRRPGAGGLAGVLLGLGGLAVLSLPGLTGEVKATGIVLVLLAALFWSLGSFSSAYLPMPADPFTASAYEMIAGGLGSLVLGLAKGERHGLDLASVSGRSWAGLGYLVVFGSLIGFTAYAWLLQRAPLSLVATYAYVNPVVAVALGALFLREALTWPLLLGGVIVVGGVGLIVSTERRG
ncbi:EamA family transporter [Streptomyces sp. CBMA291]|nr:EamA family transporter [Streptomyces sp. CBMA291]MBD0718103.1 EamA family transporter [Streptomyces sp. CBMA370]